MIMMIWKFCFLYSHAIQVNPVEFVSDYFMSLCGRSTDSQHQSAADQNTTSQQTLQLSKSMQGEISSIIARCYCNLSSAFAVDPVFRGANWDIFFLMVILYTFFSFCSIIVVWRFKFWVWGLGVLDWVTGVGVWGPWCRVLWVFWGGGSPYKDRRLTLKQKIALLSYSLFYMNR